MSRSYFSIGCSSYIFSCSVSSPEFLVIYFPNTLSLMISLSILYLVLLPVGSTCHLMPWHEPCHTMPHHTRPYHAIPWKPHYALPPQTIIYCTASWHTRFYYTMPCLLGYATPSHATPDQTMPCYTRPNHIIPHFTISYYTTSDCITPYHACQTAPCHPIPFHTMPGYPMPCHMFSNKLQRLPRCIPVHLGALSVLPRVHPDFGPLVELTYVHSSFDF